VAELVAVNELSILKYPVLLVAYKGVLIIEEAVELLPLISAMDVDLYIGDP